MIYYGRRAISASGLDVESELPIWPGLRALPLKAKREKRSQSAETNLSPMTRLISTPNDSFNASNVLARTIVPDRTFVGDTYLRQGASQAAGNRSMTYVY
jgi:hypothetical protein